ncbi:MAG TPA: tetratricopeptide repeat protein [Caulobacteraceae bacterium]|nr:tetratricopeptide repeat protein [Caulobacteraceae bacterium]
MAADYLGNPVSTGDAGVLAAVDDFVGGMLAYETRAAGVIKAAAAAPDAPLLNAYAALLFTLMESPQGPVRARPFLDRAEAAAAGANDRERALIACVAARVAGDLPAAERIATDMVEAWPRDLLMLKLAQGMAFDRGDAAAMLRPALNAARAADDVAYLHGMVAFALEQSHRLADAEAEARRALEMTPREPWAQHALAHVMLTEGRIDEGARFMAAASAGWGGLNSFMATHNWWHLALFRLSQGREAEVLALYDDHVWAGDRDYSQDQINAVSLLARLELAGADVGERWSDVANHLAARVPDVEQPFLALQYLYGLARAGRPEAETELEAIRRHAETAPDFCRAAWANVALPAAEGIAAHLAGRHAEALARLGPVLPRMAELGGSHAQRDLFEQIWLASAIAAGRWAEARVALERRARHDPDGVPLNRQRALVFDALGLLSQAGEARRRVEATLRRNA